MGKRERLPNLEVERVKKSRINYIGVRPIERERERLGLPNLDVERVKKVSQVRITWRCPAWRWVGFECTAQTILNYFMLLPPKQINHGQTFSSVEKNGHGRLKDWSP